MPKTKKDLISEHYNLHVMEVPLGMVGHVMAVLQKMGIATVAPELVTTEKRWKSNKNRNTEAPAAPAGGGEKKAHDRNADELIIDLLKQNKKMHLREIKAAFEAQSRSHKSVNSQVHTLLRAKVLKRLEAATYGLNDTAAGKAATAKLLKKAAERRTEKQAKAIGKLGAEVARTAQINGHAAAEAN